MFAICVVHVTNNVTIILQLKNFKSFLFQGLLFVMEGFPYKELKVCGFLTTWRFKGYMTIEKPIFESTYKGKGGWYGKSST